MPRGESRCTPGERDGLAYLGWATAGPPAFETALARLAAQGVKVHVAAPSLTAERDVAALAWFVDPLGFRHELSWGLRHRPSSFHAARAMRGFVTGAGGLGHAVLLVPDQARAERFFSDALGLRLSDRIATASGLSASFMHCNPRHHSLAFVGVPSMVGFHHLMLEVVSLDDVGTARDRCVERNVPIVMDLGRHTNDHMTSFYMRTPSGFEIEYGWGGVLVDDAQWLAASYDSTSIWGHRPVRGQQALPPGILKPFKEQAP